MMAHAWLMKETIRAYTIDATVKDDHGAVQRFVLIPIIVESQTDFPAVFYMPSQTETLTRTGLVYMDNAIMQIAHPAIAFAMTEFIARKVGNSWAWYRVIGRAQRAMVGKTWGWEMTVEKHQGETPMVISEPPGGFEPPGGLEPPGGTEPPGGFEPPGGLEPPGGTEPPGGG